MAGPTEEIIDDLDMISKLSKPIKELNWLERSLLFAELAKLSYYSDSQVTKVFQAAGIGEIQFIEHDGAQAYILGTDDDCMIICRGTEPGEWNDVKADANAFTVMTEVGRLHSGFNAEVDDLWPLLEQSVEENQRPMWFAGHSLGGAMATICAGRCKMSNIPSNPSAIFTFGSPRVGNKRYINFVRVPHYRWVNNNDVVTRVPPTWLGYRHSGQEIYLDSDGELSRLTSWRRFSDRMRGVGGALLRWEIDYFADHSMVQYIHHIQNALDQHRCGKSDYRLSHPLLPEVTAT
jgi:triacylglycerol lipase